jgi:hypothetical protein
VVAERRRRLQEYFAHVVLFSQLAYSEPVLLFLEIYGHTIARAPGRRRRRVLFLLPDKCVPLSRCVARVCGCAAPCRRGGGGVRVWRRDFDPTEVAVPWKLLAMHGVDAVFATEQGTPSAPAAARRCVLRAPAMGC